MTDDLTSEFIDLYRQTFLDAARLIRNMGGNLEQTRDLFHDAILIYLEKKQAGNWKAQSDRAYLLGITRILWLKKQRKTGHTYLPDDLEIEEEPATQEETRLASYLEKAGRKCMELLSAFYYQEWPMKEIARKFGFNGERSATVQKYKCLEKIRTAVRQTSSHA